MLSRFRFDTLRSSATQRGDGFDLKGILTPSHIRKSEYCGRGGFADVTWMQHPKLGKIAIKRLRGLTEVQKKCARQEAETWKMLSHPNILEFKGVLETDTEFCLVSAFADNGTLNSYLKSNHTVDRVSLLVETLSALSFLHEKRIIHGDIKGANVLVSSQNSALVCDFGLAKAADDMTMTALRGAGSMRWWSPELFAGGTKTFQSDVWAFGMLVYEVLSGTLPFSDKREPLPLTLCQAIVQQHERPPMKPENSFNGLSYISVWNIASQCWQDDPSDRPSLAVVLQRLTAELHYNPTPSALTFVEGPTPNLRDSGRSMWWALRPALPVSPTTEGCGVAFDQLLKEGEDERLRYYETFLNDQEIEDLGPRLEKVGREPERHGGFAEVWKGKLDGKQLVAIKCLRAVDVDNPRRPFVAQTIERLDKRMKRELRVWAPISHHPRILTCLGFAMVDGVPSLVSPWCENGNARKYLDRTPDCDRKAMVAQIAEGLAYLHGLDHPVVHYDIKLPNVLIGNDKKALITDFGVAKITDEYKTGLTTSGKNNLTTKYSAPEALEGTERDPKADVYSFGMLALEVMSGNVVWEKCKTPVDIMCIKARGSMPTPEDHPGLPADDPLWILLRRCWHLDPDGRPEMEEVVRVLKELDYHAD